MHYLVQRGYIQYLSLEFRNVNKLNLNFIDTAIILIFQLSANLANRIRIKNAP
jgi:hypothetical protein